MNVIAHSMGGLDARYAISRLGLGDRVASLTTIGTPHRGTPLADRGTLALGEWQSLRGVLDTLGANVDGLYDLRTDRMERFNLAVEDQPGVWYSSVVGTVAKEHSPINTLLVPGHAYLRRTAGDNDGIVPAESQKWGEVLGEVHADHWEQIGWSRRFDARGSTPSWPSTWRSGGCSSGQCSRRTRRAAIGNRTSDDALLVQRADGPHVREHGTGFGHVEAAGAARQNAVH